MSFDVRKNMKNNGFTLVELLIGMVVSFFIITVSLTYLVSSSRTFNVQTNDSVIQENARFALEVLSQNIRLAGLNSENDSEQQLSIIYAQDLCPGDDGGDADGGFGDTACTQDGVSDRFAIDYILRSPASTCNGTDITQTMLDNNGGQLTLANVFWTADSGLSTADVNRSALYCQTYQIDSQIETDFTITMSAAAMGDALPIVDGIDRLQVQYGVDSNGDGLIDMYQSFTNVLANIVTNDAGVDVVGGLNNISSIRAVRFGLLISSGLGIDRVSSTEESVGRVYSVLDAPDETFNDSIFRQIFSTTILIPNAGEFLPPSS